MNLFPWTVFLPEGFENGIIQKVLDRRLYGVGQHFTFWRFSRKWKFFGNYDCDFRKCFTKGFLLTENEVFGNFSLDSEFSIFTDSRPWAWIIERLSIIHVLSRLPGVCFFSKMNSRQENRSKLSFTARIITKCFLERFLSICGEKMSKDFLKFCKLISNLMLGQIIVSNLTNVHKVNSRINYARLH